jgi:sulfite exporter TauE/SafE
MVYLPAAHAQLAFGLGTVPALFGTGLLTTALGRRLPHQVFRAAAVLVIALGALMRGLALLGVVPHFGIW